DGEKVVIKGSEQITDWEKTEGTVWKATVPNSLFGDYNPFDLKIFGDWVVRGFDKHLGDVYLNGVSLYEASGYEELLNPVTRETVTDDWTETEIAVLHPEQTKYLWFAEVSEDSTTILANFHEYDPLAELVEINVRRSCFFPDVTGINYITVSGFEMAQAATPWAPPTAEQPGLIGPNWSKGWIIENNVIHDAKCSAVSIGKEITTGHNYYSHRGDKPGYTYQLESVLSARHIGWDKERVGSHIIRNNTIYDCGQNAVVGHLGCVFSEISDNHIYNIAQKREFYGHEIAGIKLHAAIDVQIRGNRIYNCSLGTWLDWQAQGSRVSGNIFYNNSRDIFVEVSHGPFLLDHNLFASDRFMTNAAQGGAYVNNLICGSMQYYRVLDRATPYQTPHSTEVKGYAVVYSGDDRYFNNIFVGKPSGSDTGTAQYNGCSSSLEEYIGLVKATGLGDLGGFLKVMDQPVYINNNVYLNGALAYGREQNNLLDEGFDPRVSIQEEDGAVYLSIDLPEDYQCDIVTTAGLPRVRLADADFENPDGSELTLDRDLTGRKKNGKTAAGPVAALAKGHNRVRIWPVAE
ncbi:MAG: right-handed parallel beta-helix repeat-containing protein, partial [Clostridiales bacterium]|nr:right-handed parallel beta-helix repeat-containing protein [Clostridiales bacterium]